VIIRLLARVKGVAPVSDGGSDAAVTTTDSLDTLGQSSAGQASAGQASAGQPSAPDGAEPAPERAQLELSCRTGADGYQIVSMSGELDIATAEQAYSYISEVIDGRYVSEVIDGRLAPVTVDLSDLTFCDASGLGALARTARHAREAGRQLMLTSARPSVVKVMRITGLDRIFPELRPRVHAYSA
jgi:anti-sigma B factor antagonist